MAIKEDDVFVELDMEELLTKGGQIDALFYLRDLKERKLFLNSEIDLCSIEGIVGHILRFNAEDKGKPYDERMPVKLYITSNGGDVDAGFELIDVILQSQTPVYTINLGYQYSMGFLIGLAGHKRFAAQNSKFLMHDGSQFIYNSGAKAQDQMEFQKKVEERVMRYVLSRTDITPEMYEDHERVEWYMFADEAKELGVTNFIIGEDCDIDEVI